MSNAHGQLIQVARSVLRASEQYPKAVRLGVARDWLAAESYRLAERLQDEAWKWTPAEPVVPDLMAALEESLSPGSHPTPEEDR